jgi:phosphosulfolactate phosphohydrolase-like enzyme
MKTVYKYVEEFQATSSILDKKRAHTVATVCLLTTCKTVYVVSSNMGEMKYGPSTYLLYITIL